MLGDIRGQARAGRASVWPQCEKMGRRVEIETLYGTTITYFHLCSQPILVSNVVRCCHLLVFLYTLTLGMFISETPRRLAMPIHVTP